MVPIVRTRVTRGKQAMADNEEVDRFLCTYVVGSALSMPGETQRLTLTVDDDVCEGGGVISMMSMLG